MTAIRLRGVCPTGDTEWCQATDIAIADGAFFVIRTTPNRARRLARLVLGLDAPAEGTVEVLGLELQTASRAALDQVRRSVGSVLQPDGLLGAPARFRKAAIEFRSASGTGEASGLI